MGKVSRGMRVKTNDKFLEVLAQLGERDNIATLPWFGEVMHPKIDIQGCWAIHFDHIPVMQFINEDYLEPVHQ